LRKFQLEGKIPRKTDEVKEKLFGTPLLYSVLKSPVTTLRLGTSTQNGKSRSPVRESTLLTEKEKKVNLNDEVMTE